MAKTQPRLTQDDHRKLGSLYHEAMGALERISLCVAKLSPTSGPVRASDIVMKRMDGLRQQLETHYMLGCRSDGMTSADILGMNPYDAEVAQ